ncbi:hypothetical protein KQI42_19405 [Tissierella sp. MSJ-40]|uniref:Cyclic lactone autoinducer peptide n=1 Tax=Tissierella simiarum TaxID=2841534 RepID=A0ABS6EBN5_9FIRM|nr:hypothetical protein [Tissierella simiarum]MBU5440164.1 hypothetical protein [Tissierella simiarum]
MKIKKALVGFISLTLILFNLNLGFISFGHTPDPVMPIFTFGHTPDPVMPTSTFYSILKK